MCKLFKVNEKRHQSNLTDIGTLKNVGIFTVNFEKIPHLFPAFHCWIWGVLLAGLTNRDQKYRQVKITKHIRTGANHMILTKRIKLQLEKKLVLNLKSMQDVGFA